MLWGSSEGAVPPIQNAIHMGPPNCCPGVCSPLVAYWFFSEKSWSGPATYERNFAHGGLEFGSDDQENITSPFKPQAARLSELARNHVSYSSQHASGKFYTIQSELETNQDELEERH
jgi:hypothetical protein